MRSSRQARFRRSAQCLLVTGAAAVVLAGCGGSKAPSVARVGTTTAATTAAAATSTAAAPSQTQPQQAALNYARCMRANGVPRFPDPSAGGGFTFDPTAGVDPSAPAFRTARAKCQKYMDLGSGLFPGTRTHPASQWLSKMVKAAHCMRRHGVPNFPDPTTTIPSLGVLGGQGLISDIEGAVFVFTSSIDTQSPAFVRAAKACGFPLHNH